MSNCCDDKSCEMSALRSSQRRVLWFVLVINAIMFLIEGAAGVIANSTSLLADTLDMLGDALVHAFSLFVLTRSARWQASAALAKGGFMFAFGVAVLGEATYKMFHAILPTFGAMGVVGALALIANLSCFVILYRHRGDNLNMNSTWLCARNDLIANLGVLSAAAAGYLAASQWPDIVVGALIASVFLKSALAVLRGSFRALRETRSETVPAQS
jgi:cation diffusion facilitator family transporter